MLVGYILGRTNALGPHGAKVLSTLTFLVGLPSLMFSMIATRHITDVLSETGLISVATAPAMMVLFAIIGAIARWGVRRTWRSAHWPPASSTAPNLGVPLSLYVLGNATYVTPIMLFQLAIVTPIALTILDLSNPGGEKPSAGRIVARPFRNPVIMLIIFGMSLHGLSPRGSSGDGAPTLVAVFLKSVAQPVLACALAVFV